MPKGVIYNDENSGSWQTRDLEPSMQKGHIYRYDGNKTDYNNGTNYGDGGGFLWDVYSATSDGGVEDSEFKVPLYQGYFLADSNYVTTPSNEDRNNMPGNYTNENKPEYQESSDTPNDGTITNNDVHPYNDFYWQANMAQRPTTRSDQVTPRASVTGLVDNSLSNGMITQGGVVLPYFYKSYTSGGTTTDNSLVTSGLMKCWESTEEKSISFPFYEVLSPVSTSAGGDLSSNQQATFYQFNSKDSTLHFKYNDINPEKSYFE